MARNDEPRSTGQEIQAPETNAVSRALDVRAPAAPDRLNRQVVQQTADVLQGGWAKAQPKIKIVKAGNNASGVDGRATIFPRKRNTHIRPIGWQFKINLINADSGALTWAVVDDLSGGDATAPQEFVARLRTVNGDAQTGGTVQIVADRAENAVSAPGPLLEYSGTALFKPTIPGIQTELLIQNSTLSDGIQPGEGIVTARVAWLEVPQGVELPR